MHIKTLSNLALSVFLFAVSSLAFAAQNPWQSNAAGMLATDYQWPSYSMGYEFTPGINGQITQLGGFFNGTMEVKLFNTTTGEQLASTMATATNSWGYSDITPINVTAGTTYTVALISGWPGTGVSMRFGFNFPEFPQTYQDITIEDAVFGMGSTQPTFQLWNQMWGQADITFEPNP